MIEGLLLLSLLVPRAVWSAVAPPAAPAGAPSALSPGAAPAGDPAIYTAPLDAAGGGDTPALAGKRLSRARLRAFAWGHPGVGLEGADLYLNGRLMGASPLALGAYLASAAGVTLGAEAPGYAEASRPGLVLPAEGDVAIALLPNDAAASVTDPGWALGLGLIVAGVLVYRADSPDPGLTLAGGGLLGVGLTQLWARFVTLPRLRAAVKAYNDRPEPEPQP